ncbi:MAG: class I SAM-dependent methyltransferase family protein [Thermoprotei archaeon]
MCGEESKKGLKVPKVYAEDVRLWLYKNGLIDRMYNPIREGDYIIFPLIGKLEVNQIEYLSRFNVELVDRVFSKREVVPKSLYDVLERSLTSAELALVPGSIDIIGEIALIEIPDELWSKVELIGKAVMHVHKNVRAVYAKRSVRGVYRVRDLKFIIGEPITETLHKEYGARFLVDVTKAFFDPRLSWEHNRVANLVKKGEVVVDMFSGVGPFAIQIARKVDCKVYAIDLNPDAYNYLVENIELNKVSDKVVPIHGDARVIIQEMLRNVADRVIMNHPSQSHEFLSSACMALKSNGVIHFYSFQSEPNPVEKAVRLFNNSINGVGCKVKKIMYSRKVKSTAPHEYLVVLDVEVIKLLNG